MMDANELERAKAYAESIVWRLETLQSRSRYNIDTGKLKRLPTRLRRFSNGIPQDNVASTLEALEAMAPYRGIIYNGEDDLDHEYRPTTTLIRKDDSMKSGGDATYTIIQDLILMGERDLYLMGDSSSCSQVSETEWHWDEGEIVECPQGGQGVSYRIENVSRSAENDLFSYAVRKVQAVTQHMPAMTVECSEDSVVTLETWDNVYGEPGAFRWDDVVHDGGALDVPNPCTGKSGLLVKVQVQENPDCTFKVSVERTTSKVDEGAEYMRYRDQYKIQTMDLVTHAAKPLPKAGVEYSDGVMTKYEVKQNPDGTYDNRTTVETEREVAESTVLKRVTPFHTVVERTDTNVKSPLTGLPAGVKYGTYESTKTPGGRYTVKLTTLEYRFDNSALFCKKTIFQHDHSIDTSVAEMPADSHVVEAGGGVVHDIRFRTDEMGGVVKTESTTTELRVPSSTERRSVMPYRTRVERIDTNMPAPASALLPGFKYGSYEFTRTPGGLYTNQYIGIENVQMDLGYGCKKTAFQHDHSAEETVQTLPAESHVAEAGGGKVFETKYRVDGEGTIVKTTTESQEIQESESAGGKTLTARYEITKRTDTNMSSKASGLLSGFQYGSYQFQMTPGKWYVNEYVGYKARKLDIMRAHTADIFRHEDTVENTADGLPGIDHTMAGGGTITSREARLDENGISTVVLKTVKELSVPSSMRETLKTPRFTVVSRIDTNMGSAASGLAGGSYGSYKSTRTPGGLYTNEYRYYTPTYLRFAASCSKTVFQHEHSTESTVSGGVAGNDVQSAGGGRVYSRQDRMGEEGVVVRTERYVQEIAAPSSSFEMVKTPRAIITRQTDTNMSTRAGALRKGQFGSYKYTVTQGGWFVNEYLSVEMNPGAKSQKSRTRDAFREEHVDTESKESLDAVPEHVVEANHGVIHKQEGHTDDQGITTVTTTEIKELNVPNAEVKLVRTARGTIKTVKHRNVQNKSAGELASQAGSFKTKDPGTAEERTTNPGRTTDVIETEFLPAEGLQSADACQVVSTEHTHRSSKVVGANEKVEAKTVAKAGGGKYSSEEITVKEDGAKVRETVEVVEYNRIYGSRVHEDALQSYRVVDRTSDATNIGDASHQSNIGDASHAGPGGSGSASDLQSLQKFGTHESKASASSNTNSGATIELSGDLTLNPAAPQSGFRRGTHVDQDSELTKGGRFRTKDYKFVARPHKWKDFIKTEHYISLKWTFRNLEAGEITPLVQEIVNEAAKYCRGTFTVRPDISRTINDFGLYDGTVSFVASSPPNVGSCATGKRQIPEADKMPATKIADWWEKSISIVPVTSLNPNEYTGTAWFRVNVEWRHLEQGWGRGEQNYRNFLQDDNHSFWADSKHSYNVESQLFTYTKVKERKVYVYLQKGEAVSSSATKPTLSSDAINSLSEHNRDASKLGS